MFQITVPARPRLVKPAPALHPARFAAALAAAGTLSGVALAFSMFALKRLLPGTADWELPVFGAPVVPFVGVPVVLASGWVMLSLWYTGHRQWVLAGIVTATVGLAVTATAGFAPLSGMSTELASVLGAMEALVAGVLVADRFGCVNSEGVLIGLAADIWVLMSMLALFGNSLLLTPVLSVAMGVIVASPMLGVAVLSGKRPDRTNSVEHVDLGYSDSSKGRTARRPIAWLLVAFCALPAGLGASYGLAMVLIPR